VQSVLVTLPSGHTSQ